MPRNEYLAAQYAQADAIQRGFQAQANATMNAAVMQAQAATSAALQQIRSDTFLQAQRLDHDLYKIEDERRHTKEQQEHRAAARHRFLAFQHTVRVANPGTNIDPDTLEYLWRNHEAQQRTAAQARFTGMVNDFRATLAKTAEGLPQEIETLRQIRPLSTSRRFLPVAIGLGLLTVYMAFQGFFTFLLTAAILGGLGYRAVTKYREVVPWAPSERVDLALVGARKALPIAAIAAGWSGMIDAQDGSGFGPSDKGAIFFGLVAIGVAIWVLVRRKDYYGLEFQQNACDKRVAQYNADTKWVNSLSFEKWYDQVLRQPQAL